MSSYIEGLHIRDLSLPGEHSEVTHPPVAEEEKDAVAWVASYHRSDWDEAFLPLSADRSSSLRSAMRHPFPSPPKSDMDTINHLPTKIVWQILGPLDNGSLLSFRQVNRRARQMVTAMPSYRLIADYAIDAVIGLHEPGLAFKFTPGDIEAALSVSTCQTRRCTQFAGYVHLPNLARYCFHCAYKCMCSCWKLRWPADVSRSIPYTCHSRRALQPPDRTCRVCNTKAAPGMPTDLDYCPLDLAPMPHVDFSRAIDNTSGEAAPARRYRDDHGVCCTGCYVRGAWKLTCTFQGRRYFEWRTVSNDMTRERFYGELSHPLSIVSRGAGALGGESGWDGGCQAGPQGLEVVSGRG
jgi:hypothetical protein